MTPGQLALSWPLHQGDDLVPIPGTKRRERLEENAEAVNVQLSQAESRLAEALPIGAAAGERYDERGMRTLNH